MKLLAVLVDLGETLVHFAKPWEEVSQVQIEALYDFCRESGLPVDFQQFGQRFVRVYEKAAARSDALKVEVPMEEIVVKCLSKFYVKNLSHEFIQAALQRYFTPEIDAWELYPDTFHTLSKLAADRYKLGLISNAKSEWAVREILYKYDLQKFFETVITSATLRIRKPRSDIFSKALTDLNVKAAETVFIGDSLEADISGAKNVGIHSIYLQRRPTESPNLVYPEATVSSLTEALDTVIAWNTGS